MSLPTVSWSKSGDVPPATEWDIKGEISTRKGDDLWFGYRESNVDELVILEGSLKLQQGETEEITRRMRKLWIMKKATQPLSFQSAGCIFKNPRGLSAGSLIEQDSEKARNDHSRRKRIVSGPGSNRKGVRASAGWGVESGADGRSTHRNHE